MGTLLKECIRVPSSTIPTQDMEYDSAIIGMKGKDCVAIATDTPFCVPDETESSLDITKVFHINAHTCIGFLGQATDICKVYDKISSWKSLYEVITNVDISPEILETQVSKLFFETRFPPYCVEAVIVALDGETCEPYMCDIDIDGCVNMSDNNFVVLGNNSSQLYGLCESLWQPDMEDRQLLKTISEALVSACNRDANPDWGGKAYIIKKDIIVVHDIKTQID